MANDVASGASFISRRPVGLGKTVEAGMTMMEYITRGLARKILIIVPPSLVEQWYTEMKRKFNLDFIKADDPEFKNMGDASWGYYDKVLIFTKYKATQKFIVEYLQTQKPHPRGEKEKNMGICKITVH
ncbi:SNF2-related protein [Clostridium estertheticum]|uniref:SNF2-related protein n=1 Tax=Clostridium estertheticum TaxID=238834 RepID=UPI001CF30D93|nr:SNF2-related protein [Clostridium estertheticum]MCB2356689.1 hypothetical protein [Clostridium estertheticum]WAG42783.1 hypothetical protein LL065_08970 [Clostridium estertheticum]